MKKLLFSVVSLLFINIALNAQYGITVTLKPPTVGSTSATINATVSGLISSYTTFDVVYGETPANLNKTKRSGVTFGPGVLLLNGFTLGTTIDSLKQQTKYYYKYVTNDTYQSITNKYTALDSFTTTKEPFKVSIVNPKTTDTASIGSFISKLNSTDPGITKHSLTIDPTTSNKYFTIKNDSLFTAVKFDTLKIANYSIKVNSLFSDNTSTITTFIITVLDKTPPTISTKIDTLNVVLGLNLSVNVSTTDFNKITTDNRSNVTLTLSKYNFDCSNIGLNKIDFIAKDDSLNISTKSVFVNVKDTVKPNLFVVKEKTLYMDSLGKAIVKSSDLELTSLIPDSSYARNMSARFLLDIGSTKNLVDSSNVLTNQSASYVEDRFGVNSASLRFNGINSAADIGKDAVKVTTTTPYTISLWAKPAYTPTTLTGFGTYQDYNGHRYFKSNSTYTWKQAKAICDSLKGYLTIPNNSGENTFLKTMAAGSLTWIGISDEITEGKYLSVFGDSVSYFNWKSGQPDNFNDEDYVHIDANGLWNDGPNSYLLNFIIEFDINSGVFLSKYQNLDAANSSFFISSSSVAGNGTNSLSFATPDSNWNHYVYVLNSGTNNTKVFINGSLVKTGTVNYNPIHSATTPVYLGRVSGSPSNYYNGIIDDIRIYNKVLTDTQIIALYTYEKLKPSDRLNQTSDNCSITQKIISQSSFSCSDLGTKTITYSVIDKSANRVDSTISITLKDTIKPVIKVKNVILRVDNSANLKLDYTDIDDGSFDNCSIDTRVLSKTEFALKDTGQIIVNYTLTDKSGNSKNSNVTFTLACKDPVTPSDQTIEICQGSTPKALQVNAPTGSTGTLNWYTTVSGGTPSTAAPSPPTNNTGVTDYYVSHLLNGCESSKRAKISVLVKPIPAKPTLSRDSTGSLVSSTKIGNVWVKDGQALSDSLQTFKPTSPGSYQVKNTLNGCFVLSDPYYYIITDVVNLGLNEFIKVYPNPYINKVNIEFNLSSYPTLNIDIIDIISGVKIISKQPVSNGTPLYLGQLSGGTYLIKIYSNDYKISHQFKMIKM